MENSSKQELSIAARIGRSISFKAIIIFILVLLMLIPIAMIRDLIREREMSSMDVSSDITSKWGATQQIKGPMIIVPYLFQYKDDENKVKEQISHAYFLPEELNVTSEILPEILHRGIYKSVVYNSTNRIEGSFKVPDFTLLDLNYKEIYWDRAIVCLALNDMRGVRNQMLLQWGDQTLELEAGTRNNAHSLGNSGDAMVSAPIHLNPASKDSIRFQMDLNLSGSQRLYFYPLGKSTHVEVKSNWSSPSFDGTYLPSKREVSAEGFTAEWDILEYNRNSPQQFTENERGYLTTSSFYIDLIFPVDHYQQVDRSVKYAIMFIILTFIIFFLVEIITKRRIHPLQYILVSAGLVLFYTLLLSLSEQINFQWAYVISALATIGLICSYAHTIFREWRLTRIMMIFFCLLYTFLYIVLQLEDYSLLFGSIGLFATVGAVMYASRNVKWYQS